jgi:hypothetical protein
MFTLVRSTWLVLLAAGLLVAACAAPQAAATPTSVPAPATQPEPAQPESSPTAGSGIPGEQVAIPVPEDNETFPASVTGQGETGVILADTFGYDPSGWLPLVEALAGNETLRIVTFAYRDEDATPNQDTRAVFDYLRAEGIERIICVGAGYGARACGFLQDEPEMAGMVLMVIDNPTIEADVPKLFLTADADPLGMAGTTERVFDQSAEPKEFKTYPAGVHGPALFQVEGVGPQALADITGFIDRVLQGQ